MKKMKGFCLLIAVGFMSTSMYSQIVVSSGSMSDRPTIIGSSDKTSVGKGVDLDEQRLDIATIRCYYYFTQKNPKEKEPFRNDTLTLDIGSKSSRYYDEAKIKRDSLFSGVLPGINMTAIKSISVIKDPNSSELDYRMGDRYENNFYDGTTEQIYKNRPDAQATIIDYENPNSSLRYKCSDPIGNLDWKITNDTATVLNYHCQKATLNFRGRNYQAWFAPELPTNDGPWKFFGLPGLILKVTDSEGLIAFECIGLQFLDAPYPIVLPKGKYANCNRKELETVIKRRGRGMDIIINGGNIVIASKSADTSYKPLELE